ncbi:MAG: electron transport complex subunit E [Gammaproteobacteria bacterium]|nr:electron transport complex subunit E [Gammaproteobacteria bacterium]
MALPPKTIEIIELPETAPPGNSTDEFIKGLWRENPIFIQLLGMCPTLAVTNSANNALAMGLATTFVLIMSSTLVSLLRHLVPRQVRIATYIMIIATFVTAVDYIIQAISLELHAALGAFISLIVVNCLILGRAEAFASKNTPGRSFLDALGMGIGFTIALLCLGISRELLGSGSLFGLSLFPAAFEKWVIMVLPSGGFFTLGLWLLLFNGIKRRQALSMEASEERQETSQEGVK